jgi:hypothetical protein
MPSHSEAQARMMAAIAHGWRKPGGGGPSRKVAEEFNQADKGGGLLQRAMAHRLRRGKRSVKESESASETKAEKGIEE